MTDKLTPALPPVPLIATTKQNASRAESTVGGAQNMVTLLRALVAPVSQPSYMANGGTMYLADGGDVSFDTPPEWYAQQAASVLDNALAPVDYQPGGTGYAAPMQDSSASAIASPAPTPAPAMFPSTAPSPYTQPMTGGSAPAPIAMPAPTPQIFPGSAQASLPPPPTFRVPNSDYADEGTGTISSPWSRLYAQAQPFTGGSFVPPVDNRSQLQKVLDSLKGAASLQNTARNVTWDNSTVNSGIPAINPQERAAGFVLNAPALGLQQIPGEKGLPDYIRQPLELTADTIPFVLGGGAPVAAKLGQAALMGTGQYLGGKAGEQVANAVGVDPRIGNLAGSLVGPGALNAGLGLTRAGIASMVAPKDAGDLSAWEQSVNLGKEQGPAAARAAKTAPDLNTYEGARSAFGSLTNGQLKDFAAQAGIEPVLTPKTGVINRAATIDAILGKSGYDMPSRPTFGSDATLRGDAGTLTGDATPGVESAGRSVAGDSSPSPPTGAAANEINTPQTLDEALSGIVAEGSAGGPPSRPPATAGTPPGSAKPPAGPGFVDDPLVAATKQSLQRLTQNMDTGTSAIRSVTAKVGGNLEDPYLSQVVDHENALRKALIAQEAQRIPQIPPGATLEQKAAILNQQSEAIAGIDQKLAQFRLDALKERYGNTRADLAAAQTALAKNDQTASHLANDSALRAANKVQSSFKEAKLGLDVGTVLQQDLKAVRVGGTSMLSAGLGKAADAISKALGGGGVDVYTNDRLTPFEERTIAGVIPGGAEAAGLERPAFQAPTRNPIKMVGGAIQKLNDVQYNVLGDLRTKIYEGRLYQDKLLGIDISDPAVKRSAADFANMATSTARPGTSAGRAFAEKTVLLSPQITRSQFAEMATPLKTLSSPSAALNTANQLLSTAAVFGIASAINQALGVGDKLTTNPLDPMFGKITLKDKDASGNNIVVSFLPQFSTEKATLQSVAALKKAAQGDANAQQTLGEIGKALDRYSTGRLNTGLGALYSMGGFGYDQTGQFHYGGGMPLKDRVQSAWPMPLSAQPIFDKSQRDPLSVGLNIAGGTAYGESATPNINRILARIPAAEHTDINGKVVNNWYDLSPATQNDLAAKYPEFASALQKKDAASSSPFTAIKEQSAAARQQAFSAFQQNGNGAEYRAALADAGTEAKIRYDQESKGQSFATNSPEKKLLDSYFSQVVDASGKDYNLRDQLDAEFRAKLSPAASQALDDNLQTSADPNYEKLKAARSYLNDNYWNKRDDAYQQLLQVAAPTSPLKQYATYEELSKAAADRTVSTAVVDKLKSAVDSRLNDATAKARYDDPKADALLYIYGYRDSVISPTAQAMVVAWAKENGVNLAAPPVKR